MNAYSNMASSRSSFCSVIKPSQKCRTHQSLQVRAQRFRDEGRSSNIVDANLSLLRERVEEVRIKERLERCFKSKHGWNYAPGYNYNHKREERLSQYFELVGLVGGPAGLSIFSGTAFLCFVSLIVHLNY